MPTNFKIVLSSPPVQMFLEQNGFEKSEAVIKKIMATTKYYKLKVFYPILPNAYWGVDLKHWEKYKKIKMGEKRGRKSSVM